MVKWIIIAVLLLPVAEIATFVVVALLIGWGWAFLLMAATTFAGFVVLKRAGRGRLANFGAAVTRNDTAGIEANAGSFLAILGGILLFLPGFLTDLAGAALLLPPVRRACAARFRAIIGTPTSSRSVLDLEPDEWRQVPDRETPRDPDQLDKH
jgi:UPF0716 protein FxsA